MQSESSWSTGREAVGSDRPSSGRNPRQPESAQPAHVQESRFGVWFIGTETWAVHVVKRALDDLERLMGELRPTRPVIVDVGCGWGHSLPLLADRFRPERLIGIDIDPQMVAAARERAARKATAAEIRVAAAWRLPVADASTDMVFCHQTFHHLVEQHAALAEFYRILRPGGLLLFAESTKAYIDTWLIRALFRHPMEVQRSAPEYLAMIRAAGFEIDADAVSYPYLWWSRTDLGLRERLLGLRPSPQREETLINLVAIKR